MSDEDEVGMEEMPMDPPPKDDNKTIRGMKTAFAKMSTSTNEAMMNVKKGVETSVSTVQKSVETSMTSVQKSVETSVNAVQKGVETSVTAVKQSLNNVGANNKIEPDVMAETEEEALEVLQKLVEEEKMKKQQDRPQKWNFATVPLETFHKTVDDVFLAFIRWAKAPPAAAAAASTSTAASTAADTDKNDNKTSSSTAPQQRPYNVTRAFDRLHAYASWMDNTGRDMIDPPLSTESIKDTWKAWNMKVSFDKAGHLVWWFDITTMDLPTVKAISPTDNLRLFVWFAHFVMFDPHAQEAGCVLVQNLGKIQLWTSMTMVDPALAHKVDRLTTGTLPVLMKQIYICESPQWATILLKVMKPFLSPVVKDRILFLENPKLLEDILGQDSIPTGFLGTHGKLEKDIVWAAFSMD